MAQEFKDDDAPDGGQDDALKKAGFDANWEYAKHVAKTVAMTALKGAVIGGLALATLSLAMGGPAALVSGIPFVGTHVIGPVLEAFSWGAADWIVGGLMAGATMGAVAGGAIGLANGFSGAEDAVEDKEQYIRLKDKKERLLAVQQNRLEMNAELMMASKMPMGVQPQVQPQLPMGQGMGQNAGPGMGGKYG
ncbi:MAG: hypothetical protein SFX19_08190 [Alphaproteobacteria bacterium]|nr:hypothetical protein [Alphaproteobacteria bacterium]